MIDEDVQTPLAVLSRVFGYASFRGQQQEIIEHVVAGGDAIVLMPTGGGKSLCYQLPALLRPGVGVVVRDRSSGKAHTGDTNREGYLDLWIGAGQGEIRTSLSGWRPEKLSLDLPVERACVLTFRLVLLNPGAA